MAGLAAFWCGLTTAVAEDLPPLGPDEIELSAETVHYHIDERVVTAAGAVLVKHEGYVLLADQVVYDEKTGEGHAEGNVKLRDPNGNVMSADRIELNDTLKEGFVSNVRLLLADGSRVAARQGRRVGDKTRFEGGVYSPCHVCSADDQPLWQIKAVTVTHDQTEKRLKYQDVRLEILGVPIFWTPWLSHPDPSVEKASGFLVPEIRVSPELGTVLEVPFFWNLAPNRDLTLRPIITTNEGPVLAAEYREHLGFGKFRIDGSLTYTDERDDFNVKTGDQVFRGHVFSDGQVDHSQRSRSRIGIRWASDDTFLRRYDISNEDTLRSHYTFESFMNRSYLAVQGLAFQGLRVEDVAGLTPFVLPSVDYFYESGPVWQGLRLDGRLNALALTRTSGMDTRRISGQFGATMPKTFKTGVIAELSASLRGDVYHVSDADRPDSDVYAGEDGFSDRFLPRAALNLRWPLINNLGRWTQTLEPMVLVVAAREGGNPDAIPNEDSRAFDLDDSNLFSLDRFSGLDRWEGGSRATYGARWALLGKKFDLDVLVGQSYRFEEDSVAFPDGTGLSGNFSDFVGRVGVNFTNGLELTHRFRIDKNDLAIRRNEVEARIGNQYNALTIGYVKLNRDLDIEDLPNREEIRLSAQVRLSQRWLLRGGTIQDLSQGRDSISQSVGVVYQDECLEFRLNYRKNFTADRDFEPGTTITVNVKLRNLG